MSLTSNAIGWFLVALNLLVGNIFIAAAIAAVLAATSF